GGTSGRAAELTNSSVKRKPSRCVLRGGMCGFLPVRIVMETRNLTSLLPMIVQMPLAGFHPTIQRWFTQRFGEPTEPQREGWPLIRGGGHTLISAPTGTGKTIAAYLSAIDRLM